MNDTQECTHPKNQREFITAGDFVYLDGDIKDTLIAVEVCTVCGEVVQEDPEEEIIF